MTEPINKELSHKATGILNIMGDQELIEFLNEVYGLFEMYDTDEKEDEHLEAEIGESVNDLRLIQAARVMSRIADRFSKRFKKISRKYHGFDEKCEEIAAKMEGI